ncbi:class I SAM-dependent methyltransferase [Isoptericola sp. NPDC057391]|uniref:class I SAM-dependent methyltransferase n=1 Tax=Isoptericola sp. NPDC057391 TaxID=3346117 RepID=UPI003631C6C8
MSRKARTAQTRLSRHELLAALHERLRPRTYLEVGVSTGSSLRLSSVPSIGIDPAFTIRSEISGKVHLARTTSDEYFATTDPKEWLGGPVDLAFIDGMHLFEYALRDFINVEKHCRWSSVVVFDDMLPRNVDEAARDRHTGAWAGDVFWLIEVLRRYRPDLTVLPVDTVPTGVVVVLGADPSSTVLQDHYQEILDQYVHDDPQPVPDAILRRQDAWDARTLIRRPVWGLLHRGDRPWRRRERGLAEIQEALHQPDDYRRRRRAAREKAQQVRDRALRAARRTGRLEGRRAG